MQHKESDSRDYRTINVRRRTFLRFNAAKAQRQIETDTTLSIDEFVSELLDRYSATTPEVRQPQSRLEVA